MLNFRLRLADNYANDLFVTWFFENWIGERNSETLFTRLFAGKRKTMDRDVIYALLEEAGFTISEKESTLSEIIGTPSHIETSYEMEF